MRPPFRTQLSRVGLSGLLLATLALGAGSDPGAVESVPDDLTEISLETLGQIKVTSVSKKRQDLSKAAAAVYVVTSEDIRRSGAISIPEALRMVPGIHVGRIDSNKWAVASRGFGGRFANKLLVLIDGRTVYNPLFSGVFWDVDDIPLETIERIEVIRGPGATLWGSNAVNGVINIITKSAKQMQGGRVIVGTGNQEGQFGSIHQGGVVGKGHYRAHAKWSDRNPMPSDLPFRADPWESLRGGARFDFELSEKDQLMVEGDLFRSDGGQLNLIADLQRPVRFAPGAVKNSGGHILARWDRKISARQDISLQSYVSRQQRTEQFLYSLSLWTQDAEFQHRYDHSSRGELIWGVGHRLVKDEIGSDTVFSTAIPNRDLRYMNGFVQEEWQLKRDELYLTAGSKFEESTFGGFQIQPTIRALWSPRPERSVWVAASRAVRAPSRAERDGQLNLLLIPSAAPLPLLVGTIPSPQFRNETLAAYEGGFRLQPMPRVSFDASGFYNSYNSLRSSGPLEPRPVFDDGPPHIFLPIQFRNEGTAAATGAELASKVRLAEWWRVTGTYSFLNIKFRGGIGEETFTARLSPKHQVGMLNYWDLPSNFKLDTALYYAGDIIALTATNPGEALPAYIRADIRLEWRPNDRWDFSVSGQNLFGGDRIEFQPETLGLASKIGQQVRGRISFSF